VRLGLSVVGGDQNDQGIPFATGTGIARVVSPGGGSIHPHVVDTVDLVVAIGRPAGNTSLPTGRQATAWNAGFVGIGGVTEDFTKSEVQQR